MKEKRWYLENFNKKYYLFAEYNGSNIPLYYGSLRSILKYTTYEGKSNSGYLTSIIDEETLKKIMSYNISKNEKVHIDKDVLNKMHFFMSSTKTAKEKIPIKYSDKSDLLFCYEKDLYNAIKDAGLMIKKEEFENSPKEKLEFAKFLCSLFDDKYEENKNKKVSETGRITKMEQLRILLYQTKKYNSNLKNDTFEKLVMLDSENVYFVLETINNDIFKKEKLINELLRITKKRKILSDEKTYERSYWMTLKLNDDDESRKFLESKVADSLVKYGYANKRMENNHNTISNATDYGAATSCNNYLLFYENELKTTREMLKGDISKKDKMILEKRSSLLEEIISLINEIEDCKNKINSIDISNHIKSGLTELLEEKNFKLSHLQYELDEMDNNTTYSDANFPIKDEDMKM